LQYLFDIAIFILVLGELVFFHELGHFLAAKACGIYCERFSLGMPPRLFGYKYGETDYCIGMLPIGGYVKMAGQEDVPLSEDERKEQYGTIPPNRWFMNKPVWQRVIVIAAGPFMNIVLAIAIFAILVGFGAEFPEQKHDNRIGNIEDDAPAASAPLYVVREDGVQSDFSKEPDAKGWKTGDRILSINDNPVSNIMDVAIEGVLSGGELVVAKIERTNDDGTVTQYLSPIQPAKLSDDEHVRVGIEPFRTAVVDAVLEGMPAAEAGLKKGDVIRRVDGQTIDSTTFRKRITTSEPGTRFAAEIERDGALLSVNLTPKVIGAFEDIIVVPSTDWVDSLDYSKPILVTEKDSALLSGSGFKTGDAIVSVNGEKLTSAVLSKLIARSEAEKLQVVVERAGTFGLGAVSQITLPDVTAGQLVQAVTAFDSMMPPTIASISEEKSKETGLQIKDIIEEIDGQPATAALVTQIRDSRIGQTVTVKVRKPAIGYGVMREESSKDATLSVVSSGVVGVLFDQRMTYYRAPLGRVLPEAFHETWKMMKLTGRTLQTLIMGRISAKELGGPIMIYQATTNAAKFSGYVGLMETTAFISVNLAIFNLLPLPVLDGGHLLFLAIESIRRKPISAKVMEWVQQAGLVFILGLMLFVTYNDISRWLGSLIP